MTAVPSTLYLRLHTAEPEPAPAADGGGYARVSVTNGAGDWTAVGRTDGPVTFAWAPEDGRCASCAAPLRADGPDGTFCDEVCQRAWHGRGVDPLPVFAASTAEFTVAMSPEVWQALYDGLAAWFGVVREAFESMAEAVTATATAMRGHQVGMVFLDELTGLNPAERALWLRRHRNTGPSMRDRPPRSLGQPGTIGRHGYRATSRATSGRPRKK